MAQFIFNISDSAFKVEQLPDVVTDCSTIFSWKVTSNTGNTVRFQIGQTYQYFTNAFYTQLGVDTPFTNVPVTLTYGSDLYISFALGNSGDPGRFDKCKLEVWDDTTAEPYNYYFKYNIRDNDGLPCDEPLGSQDRTYDELTDTPNTKVGNALKIVRVNAAETDHEYVDLGLIGNDLNDSRVFPSSMTWVYNNHNLGKIPSVTVIDGAGNTVHGDITYTDLNNLTITFNTAFAGTAYLN
jgi:hypothetical protein